MTTTFDISNVNMPGVGPCFRKGSNSQMTGRAERFLNFVDRESSRNKP
jgi:hypothetical protein